MCTIHKIEERWVNLLNHNTGLYSYTCNICQSHNSFNGQYICTCGRHDTYATMIGHCGTGNLSWMCGCGGAITNFTSSVVAYRDCGCLSGGYFDQFRLKKWKSHKNDLTASIAEYSARFGAKTLLNFDILNAEETTGISFLNNIQYSHRTMMHTNLLPGILPNLSMYSNYQLWTPQEKSIMTVNGVPSKLFYMEYTRSSYRGCWVKYIIVLDDNLITSNKKAVKEVQRSWKDDTSLFSLLPNELIKKILHNVRHFCLLF